MKLVVLTNILTPYRIPLFEALRHRVKDFVVLLMAKREENRQWTLGSYQFRTHLLPGFHIRPPGYEVSIHFNSSVIRTLRKIDPDIVVSGGFVIANLSAALYCKLHRKKYVGWGEITLRDRAQDSVMRMALRRLLTIWSAGSIASSSEAREAFLNYGARPEHVLTSLIPVDVTYFHEQSARFKGTAEYRRLREQYPGLILLSIGRITEMKGYQELLRIYNAICHTRSDVSLLIVGDGPQRKMVERQAKEMHLGNVYFTGFVHGFDLPRYLALADVFIFHTLYDQFGIVLSEAMAAELPVVASVHAAGTRDLVEDDVTGYRIDPRDTSASAAATLHILNMNVEKRMALGKAAYARVRQCDIETSADSIVSFLKTL